MSEGAAKSALTIGAKADRSRTIILSPSAKIARSNFLLNENETLEDLSPLKFRPEQMDVPRDLLDAYLLVKSETDPIQMNYSIILRQWTNSGMILELQFDDPLLVSTGTEMDEILIRLKDPPLLIPLHPDRTQRLQDQFIQFKLQR